MKYFLLLCLIALSPLMANEDLKARLKERYQEVQRLGEYSADEGDYGALLNEINQLRGEIVAQEKEWRASRMKETKDDDDEFAYWDQEETTIAQLVMDYGTSEYLYVIPPDISAMKIRLHSALPIPRESWTDLLEIILDPNGVGIKQLNTFARSLFVMKQDLSAVKSIITDEASLGKIPPEERIIYIFSPVPERIKGVTQFFERFRDPKRSFVYQVGYKIAIIAAREEIDKLLTLYRAVWEKENEKVTKVLSITKLGTKEMEKVLSAYFSQSSRLGRVALMKGEGDDLTILPLAHEGALVLIGSKEMVEKAEKIITETEKQILDPCEMTVFTYMCRHGDPTEISEVLEKVYASLNYSAIEAGETVQQYTSPAPQRPPEPGEEGMVPPPPVQSVVTTTHPPREKVETTNFIPYPKSGSIMMVVRRDSLEKIQEILKQLDVPKKMVQIEVLLFEKKAGSAQSSGINLLRIGGDPDREHKTSTSVSSGGILDFLISKRNRYSKWPGFDLAYNFLMSQDGVSINASPSVTTLNQTTAQIKLVEERSINEGSVPLADGKKSEPRYIRSSFGTTISITPTIHEPEFGLEDGVRYVTLETDITFETIGSGDDRPKVVRRHVENQVRIKDGETLILGGLKRQQGEEKSERVPFLGEIPGIGKLFGSSKSSQEQTEMFIFITPRIILDRQDEFERIRSEELMRRPGDVPEFLSRVQEAKTLERENLFSGSLKLLFDHEKK